MSVTSRRRWNRLTSGLYVPPFIGRLLPKIPKAEFAWYPCGCHGRDCSICSPPGGPTPKYQQVVLAGYAEPACGSCASVNETYILTQHATNDCRWVYQFPGVVCLIDYIRLDIVNISATESRLNVTLYTAVDSGLGTFRKVYGEGEGVPPCSPNNVQLPKIGVHLIDCDTSAATCFVTGL